MNVDQSSKRKLTTTSWYMHLSLLLMLSLTTVGKCFALDTFLPAGQNSIIVRAEFLPDSQNKLDITAIKNAVIERQWQPLQENYANFGYKPYPYWYRFNITNLKR